MRCGRRTACLRPGGLLAVAAPSRDDAPELAAVLDRAPLTFDAERAADLLTELFAEVEVERWEARRCSRCPRPTRCATSSSARASRGTGPPRRREGIPVPLSVTKRGALAFARKG